ncbi:hypothetical protein [Sphingobium yanoikuyae]
MVPPIKEAWKDYWPDPSIYPADFIGPRPPSDKYWKPRAKQVTTGHGFRFFASYMVLPDISELMEWIRENAISIEFRYSWEVEGRKARRESAKSYCYRRVGDERANNRFERMLSTVFNWLDNGEAFTISFDFELDNLAGDAFKLRFPWRYKEQKPPVRNGRGFSHSTCGEKPC